MRILLISYLFPRATDPRLGVFTLRQAELLREGGHEIQVVSPVPYIPRLLTHLPRWKRYRHQTASFEVSGFAVYRPAYLQLLPAAWFIGWEGPAMWWGMRRLVKGLAEEKRFDLVWAWDFRGTVAAGVEAARHLRIPCVGVAIGGDLNVDVRLSGSARRSIAQALLDCDGIACVSEALRKRVEELTCGRRESVYITTGADTSQFCPADAEARAELRRELDWPSGATVLVYVGYLLPAKGVFELVEAFDRVAGRHPEGLLVLVGEGEAREELEARVARSVFRERIRLVGHVHHDEVPKYFRAADVAVLASHHEGMPNVLLEGMASGLAILGTEVGGVPEAVPDERFGLLVPPRDAEALGRAMDRLLGDESLRAEMGRACRARAVEGYDIADQNRRLREFLEETVRRGRRPPEKPVQSLAMMVDITSNTPPYTEALCRSMKGYAEVTCRVSPSHRDLHWYDRSGARDDLMVEVVQMGLKRPGLTERKHLWPWIRFCGYALAWGQVIAEMRRRGTRVLHVQWCKVPPFDMCVFVLLKVLGIRIVYTVHDAMPHGDRSWTSAWKNRQLYRLADALVVLSEHVGRDLEEWVLPGVGHKTRVIEHPLLYPQAPSPGREEARRRLGLEDRAEMVLFFGGIEEYKGIADLIEGFAEACRQRPEMILYIAGTPWDPWEPYQEQVDRLGIADRVRAYPEYVGEEFKVRLYAAADISMLPHRDPSQSGMGLEAVALGKPVIATRAGGLPDLVEEGRTGYLVPVRDPTAIAEALLKFFGQSRRQQRAMAEAMRRLGLERFDSDLIGRKHLELYRALAGS